MYNMKKLINLKGFLVVITVMVFIVLVLFSYKYKYIPTVSSRTVIKNYDEGIEKVMSTNTKTDTNRVPEKLQIILHGVVEDYIIEQFLEKYSWSELKLQRKHTNIFGREETFLVVFFNSKIVEDEDALISLLREDSLVKNVNFVYGLTLRNQN